MDKPLTPNKIQRLIYFAEDKSFNMSKRNPCEDIKQLVLRQTLNKSPVKYESSSGILDLERVEGFGESGVENVSLSKSTAFNPGEMTGRSTGAEEIITNEMPVSQVQTFEENRRHTLNLDSLQSHCDRQTHEVNNIMRHSIATNLTFNSRRDLTADEESLIRREVGLGPQQKLQTIPDTTPPQLSLSMGTYFKSRCPEFDKVLAKAESPDRSMCPSITEVPSSTPAKPAAKGIIRASKVDPLLDSMPVRQPRDLADKMLGYEVKIDPNMSKRLEKQNNCSTMKSKDIQMDSSNVKRSDLQGNLLDEVININKQLQKYNASKIASSGHKMNDLKDTHVDRFKMQLKQSNDAFHTPTEDTGSSVDNSFSISKIAAYLGKDSCVTVSDMLNMNKKQYPLEKKHPLTELHMNKKVNQEVQVTKLIDTKKAETACSTETMNTVISFNKFKINQQKKEIPEVVVTNYNLSQSDIQKIEKENVKVEQKTKRSRSPSSKSPSTLSTVQENVTNFKFGDSSLQSSKEQWVEIITTPVDAFVGVSTAVNITVMSLSDSWLTSRFQFDNLPNQGKDFTIELPRHPILLTPGKSEQLTIYLTSNVEINTILSFTMFIKDASIDCEIEKKGNVEINIKNPTIQVLSSDGVNKITFQPIQEGTSLTKTFVLLSDCPVDLQLDLSIVEGESMFSIRNVQEIKRGDVSKILMERQASNEEGQQTSKAKSKAMNKQLCRLKSGNAIRASIKFMAPKLSELKLPEKIVTFNGSLNVHLIGVTTVLKKVDLVAVVGSVNLVVRYAGSKLKLTKEATCVTVSNKGSISGEWIVKLKNTSANVNNFPFKVSPSKFEIHPGGNKVLNLFYTGPEDVVNEGILIFEDIATGSKTNFEISGGTEKPKMFPIKTNYTNMSWVRTGRKELSLKNSIDKRVHIRCQIIGEGFSIDLPGFESRGIFCLSFEPYECRPLPINFAPNTYTPHTAALHLIIDKNSDTSRKITLYGCSNNGSVRWAGLVTYGDTALVRAVSRAPIDITLYNKSQMPVFIFARVHFNLQYTRAGPTSRLLGARRVLRPRCEHAVRLCVEWAPLERWARGAATTALATLTIITGDEYTRRRILRIIRNQSTGELDTSLLPDYLKVLVEKFDGEDLNMDRHLAEFNETKTSLDELIGGIKELTAQIDLPQDFGDENTIIISDDTVIEHHTLCD